MLGTTGGVGSYSSIAVGPAGVYWGGATGIMKMPLSGGTPVVVAPSDGDSAGIAVSPTAVFWTDWSKDALLWQPQP
jgi:hypothetical protein